MPLSLSFSTNSRVNADRPSVRGGTSLPLRGLGVFAVFSLVCGFAATSAEASCGKGYVVVPAGYAGAVVRAIVVKHRQAYAEQTNVPQKREPACTGPECRENAPVPYQAPLVGAKIKTKTEATIGAAAALRSIASIGFVRDPDEAIYWFEVAPPPTPPPNGLLVRATI